MDKDEMQIESASEHDITSGSFVFSNPNIVSSPEKIVNFDAGSDNAFGAASAESSFTFAKPTTLSRFEYLESSPAQKKEVSKLVRRIREIHRPPVEVTAEDLQDTSTYVKLKKNSKSQSAKLVLANSVTCIDVPESLLLKSVAKEYFGQFGKLVKVIVRPRKRIITLYFTTKDAATAALNKGGTYQNTPFEIQWTTPEMVLKTKKKESEKSTLSDFLKVSDDEDIRNEIEALKGLEYNLPNEPIDVVKKEVAKPKLKKNRLIVTEKPIKVEIDTQPEIPAATIEELQTTIRQVAKNAQDKYKILEARDRLLRLKRVKPNTLATAKVTKGTCPDMCPEKERYMREYQWQVSPFEQLESAEYQLNHATAIKQYSRSSADQEEPMPHDLRPVKSLQMTMSYLLHEIADSCEKENCNLAEWYHFLWDRMRSIRKDITQQELCCVESVKLIEQCARFHIVSSERLCAEELSIFDPKINSENLTKCLQTLKYMYHDLREKGIRCVNEPEFRAYIILLNLNNGSFMYELARLPPSIQHSPEIRFALQVYSSIVDNNYSRFFKLVRRTTYTNACILLLYFNQVRVSALSVMVKAYCRTTYSTHYPIYEMIDILAFEDEEEAINFCKQVGLNATYDGLHVALSKEHFCEPKSTIEQGRANRLVESKRCVLNLSIGESIAGGKLPEKMYENHKPHNSFDARGSLLPSSVNVEDQTTQHDPYEFKDDAPVTFAFPKLESKNRKTVNNSIAKKPSTISNPFSLPKSEKPSEPVSVFSRSSPSGQSIFGGSTAFNSSGTKSNVFSNSPFGTTKAAFGNDSQGIFGKSLPPTESETVDKTERVSNKRRLENSESEAEKKINAEQLRKKLKENEEQLQKERDKLKKLLEIEATTKSVYDSLQNEIVTELCSEIVQSELDEIVVIDTLSRNLYNSISKVIIEEECQEVLNQELYIRDIKQKVSQRLRYMIMSKYYQIWRLRVSSRKEEKRIEALNTTPVWLQQESVAECARSLYHPEQNIAIKYARAKRLNIPLETTSKSSPFVPIEFVIYVGLKENLKSLNLEMIPHLYWKMVISWPVIENDRVILHQHKQIVNDYLSSGDHTAEPILITHKPNLLETLNICMRHFEGSSGENRVTGTDGLLIIASVSESPNIIAKRITKIILSREKLMPIPVVVVVFGDARFDAKNILSVLENLMESGYVSEFSVLSEKMSKSIVKTIQSATLWLAVNKSPRSPLEMDTFKSISSDCLTEELWLRIQGHLAQNSRMEKFLDDPNSIINLHNEAVNHVMDIVLDPESLLYTDFPPELKRFLNPQHSLPCSFEYFNNTWKQAEYRAHLESIMTSLVLPSWSAPWPIEETMEFHEAIVHYCRQTLASSISDDIAKCITSNLFLLSEPVTNTMTFVDILLRIMHEKIEEMDDDMTIVYNKNHVRHFQTLPWWYKSNTLTTFMERESSREEPMDTTEIEESSSEESFDITTFQEQVTEVVDEFNTTAVKFEEYPLLEYCEDMKTNLKTIKEVSHELDTKFDEQKARNQLFEQRIAEALKDKLFDDVRDSPS